ncbi:MULTISPECIES: hypothetical protein [unclassified Leifsonia]|uniref:hypothetical protein n=1 Tax=unclassified Leifsonia TaxID=2663824 RepID=UPI0006F53D0E|nr:MULTISPECIES: hypothetical protein [unclassified Leifsonia]KQX08252.1 hypothetical protein ASC59_11380 [Leifsonia sp. Root1293]KRA12534.1 hypothetical protein ASD61_11380 [Leifsonia sp. Root60]
MRRREAAPAPWAPTAILLIVAGIALAIAAGIRWQPCSLDIDSMACVAAQDHLRDYGIVSAPFEPILGAVVLAALASFVMTGFWLLWASWAASAVASPAASRLALVTCLVSAAATAVIGAGQLLAAVTDAALGVLDWVPASVLGLIAFLAPVIAASVLLVLSSSRRGRLAWAVLVLGLCIGSQIAEFVLLSSLFLASHDSPIGTGFVSAATLVISGCFFGVAAIDRARIRVVNPPAS